MAEPRPLLSVIEAARALLAKLDVLSSRDPQWEYADELEDLRRAIAGEDKARVDFRAQFTQSGGVQSNPNVKYEILN